MNAPLLKFQKRIKQLVHQLQEMGGIGRPDVLGPLLECLMIRTLNEIQNCSHYLTENFLDNKVVISHISLEYEVDCEV